MNIPEIRLNLSGKLRINQINHRSEIQKKSFEFWIEKGSLPNAVSALITEGYTQAAGGRLGNADVRNYAMDYILNNPEQARIFYQEKGNIYLNTDDGDKDWYIFLVTVAAKRFRSKDKFIRWAVHYGYYKKAFYLFKNTYGLSDADYHAFDDILGDDDK